MPLDLDSRKTALVMIDLQRGIMGRPLVPHSGAEVIERSVRLGRRFKALGSLVVQVNVDFAADGADRLAQPIDLPNPTSPALPADWSEFVSEVLALRADLTITKRQWGAFHGTELDLQLRRRGIETIVLTGVATNMGVEQTAREAWQYGYAVVLVEDAVSSFDPAMHAFAIEKIMPRIARVRSTGEVLTALG